MRAVLQYIMDNDAEIRARYDAKTGTMELNQNGKSFDLVALAALVCLFTAQKNAKKDAVSNRKWRPF